MKISLLKEKSNYLNFHFVKNLLISILISGIAGCSTQSTDRQRNDPEQGIITVNGPLSVDSMGVTLIHEHILVDFIGADSTGYHRWNREKVIDKMLPFLYRAKQRGVKTIVETTPLFLGRDPIMLKEIADLSGINFLTNTGLYGAVDDKYIPEYAYKISADSLASRWVEEYKSGIEGTGIRPGFMKISVDTPAILSNIDKKIVLAAIEAHKQTGMTIVSHTGPDGPAFSQLRMLKSAGVSPSAWVWTHAQNGTAAGRLQAAEEGAWISLDNVMVDNISFYVSAISSLKRAGYLDQVLISHDAGYYDPDSEGGGEIRGYTAIFTHLIPALQEEGFTEEEIRQLLIDNPKEAYLPKKRLNNPV